MRNLFLTIVLSSIIAVNYAQTPVSPVMHSTPLSNGDNEMKVKKYNFVNFSIQQADITNELLVRTPDQLEQHPEFGILPPDAPCVDCYELLDKREPNKRQFVKYNSNGSDRFYQQAYTPYNYTDDNGWLRSVDRRLSPSGQANIYTGENQPSVTKVDLNDFNVSITDAGNEMKFNRNLKLYLNVNGVNQFISNANWSNVTVGDDGAYVTNIFPNIDLEIIAMTGAFKSNFLINADLNLVGDYLVIEDEFSLPANSSFDLSNATLTSNGLYQGQLHIDDNTTNANLFYMQEATVFDAAVSPNGFDFLSFKTNNNKLELYVPLSFVNDPGRVYPILVDPLLTANNFMNQASVSTSGRNNNGLFTNACTYGPLSVAVPPMVTVTDILWKFDYLSRNGAAHCHGGLDFMYNACRSPAVATQYWFCNTCLFSGVCGSGAGISAWAHWSGCVPPPQCPSYNMDFTMNFYERARVNAPTCSSFYITSNSNWIMTVEGRTVEEPTPPTSTNGTTICNGSSTTLTANGSFGVPPYTYSWTPGPLTGQSVTVTPPNSTTTTYTCTVTDACGNTATNSINITTQPQTMFPTPVLNYTMNPPGGTPCPVTVTFFTNIGTSYSGGPENYQWFFPGGTITSGGPTSGSANGPTYGGSGGQYTVVYNTAGTYTATIEMTDGGQCAAQSVNFTICALPITLTSFDAEVVDNKVVELDWVTESEINNDFFTIERSKDGQTFETVGIVNGAGNSQIENSYELVDTDPHKGTSYYRLKQTDFDNTSEYSDMIAVKLATSFGDVNVYPNPLTGIGYLSFNSDAESLASITLRDVAGREVMQYQHNVNKGANKIELNASEIPQGMYFITLSNNEENTIIKFIRE